MSGDAQERFRAALLDPAQPVPQGLSDGRGQPAGRRFSVYRNNIAVSLTEALESGFPVLQKLLGAANFASVMGVFLRRYPPRSPLMMHYGRRLPEFLEGFAPLAHLGYLGDVARLELALRAAYHAADADPLPAQALRDAPPDSLERARLHLAPAVALLRSAWPIFSIWAYNSRPGAPPPKPGGEAVLVVRPGFDPAPHLLRPGDATFLLALREGADMGTAQARALAAVPDFDLAALLTLLLDTQALSGLSLPEAGPPLPERGTA